MSVLALLTLAVALLGNSSASEPPGNVLILLADDLGLDALAAYGASDAARTPNIDRLATDGVLFLNAWAQPTCSPSRAAIQTGRYGFRTGVGTTINNLTDAPALPLDEITLPEMLDLGTGVAYAHAVIGKWHLGTSQVGGDLAPNLAGYSYFAGSLEGQIERYDHWRRVVNGVSAYTSHYPTTVCVDDALVWIHAQVRPWMCMVSFQAPHAPFHRPPAGLYTQSLPSQLPRENCPDPGGDPWPFYKAAVEALDTEIGRLLNNLPPADRPRTTVFFLGDNGSESCIARGPSSDRAKGTLYESGVRVPFLAAGYRVRAAAPCAALVSASDLFATVAELAGVDLAAALPGRTLDSFSIVRYLRGLRGRDARGRAFLYAESFAPNGPGNPGPVQPCTIECQPSLGFDGPGSATLAACGPPLFPAFGAHNVAWQLADAPPGANAWLLIGPYQPAFEPSVGATLVSLSPSYVGHYVTEADGTLARTTWTGSTSEDLNYQFVVQDPSQPSGFTVTNALQMNLLPTDMRAVRRMRYKLIRFDPCHDELFDLALDPFELTNLLARPLTPKESAAYLRLKADLDGLR